MKHLSINVIGKVQGVYYRASTKQKADVLGLKGTVMNLPDGSVQIEVVGEEAEINQLIEWCHDGPERAEVEKVICQAANDNPTYQDFSIIRKT